MLKKPINGSDSDLRKSATIVVENHKKSPLILPIFLFFMTLIFSSTVMAFTDVTYTFKPAEVGKAEVNPSFATRFSHFVDTINMPGTYKFAGRPGVPLLPVKTARILIPYGEEVQDIQIFPGEEVTLPGTYKIEFSKTPVPSASDQAVEDHPDPAIYETHDVFPGKLSKEVSTQVKQGARILILNLYPVQYTPSSGKVTYYESMKVVVDTSPSGKPAGTESVAPTGIKDIMNTVDNPSVLETYPGVALDSSDMTKIFEQTAETYKYVIITSKDLEPSFDILANHKISRGISATVVTTSHVYANYSGTRPDGGSDNQTRIRNFINNAYKNWGTEYVLLGGDDEIIPHRGCYGEVASTSGLITDDDIPCDLYYACLQGTWDNDADGIYGESNDGVNGGDVDLMSEVHVGRATVDTSAEADNFVSKTIAFEQSRPDESALMTGTNLDVNTWGGDHKDLVAAIFPAQWNITTLYDRDGNCSSTSVVNALNNNDHAIWNSAGHGSNGGFSHLNRTDVDGLTNTSYPFVYTWACYTASFDNRRSSGAYETNDSIAEHFVENATGAFAFVGNSRYGWFSPGSTNGTSQQFDVAFFDTLFNDNITNLGKTLADSKEDLIGSVGSTGSHRWVYFTLNLLGDPETSIIGNNSTCYAELPDPNLIFTGSEDYSVGGLEFTRYRLEVTNSADFPNEMFAAAPHLPPCGLNTNSSRTWVNIYDNNDNRLYGFCALNSADDLTRLWFALPAGTIPPESVYIVLNDRECEATYSSNLADIVQASITSLWRVNNAKCGQNSRLWARIENTGGSVLPPDARVWFYVTGPAWSGYVGSAPVAGLAAGGTRWYFTNWSIPANAQAGTYRYWALVWSPSNNPKNLSPWSSAQSFLVSCQ